MPAGQACGGSAGRRSRRAPSAAPLDRSGFVRRPRLSLLRGDHGAGLLQVDKSEDRCRDRDAEAWVMSSPDSFARLRTTTPGRTRATSTGTENVDLGSYFRADLPDASRAEVAQRCLGAAAQDGSHPPAVAGQLGPPNRVDAPVNAMQAPLPQAVLDRLRAVPEVEQLSPGDRAVLSFSDRPECGARRLKTLVAHRLPIASVNA